MSPTRKTAPAAPVGPRPVPPLARPRPPRFPAVSETSLDSGLRVLAVRRPGVPLVELRLQIPFVAPKGKGAAAHVARAELLAQSLLLGTGSRDASGVARYLQSLGGELHVSVDPDRLAIGGSVLAAELPRYLGLLAELLTDAAYPKTEVRAARDRLVSQLAMYRSRPAVIAREALLERLYGSHPYARETPTTGDVEAVGAGRLRQLHADRVVPAGAQLVLVGDVTPARAFAEVERALSGWTGTAALDALPPLPDPDDSTLLLVDRPGAVQSTFLLSCPVPRRTEPGFAALTLANLVFGGYFSSRFVANLREDKGYTYSPRSFLEHTAAGSRLMIGADVATAVTGPSWLETAYELGRIATVPVPQEELDRARRNLLGAQALSVSSQAGLAAQVATLTAAGLGLDWLTRLQADLLAVTVEDVQAAAQKYLRPTGFTSVVVGDAAVIAPSLRALWPVEQA